MGGYGALFMAGFKRQSRYRLAMVSGILANVFFGLIRTAVFVALFRQRATAGGLDLTATLTYVWVLQALFGVVFAPWMWEFSEGIRAGDVVVELLRPGDPLVRILAVDLGRSILTLVARGLPQLLIAGLAFDLRLPGTPIGVLSLALALVLSALVAGEIRFLFGSLAFWTADFRGWWTCLFGAMWFTGGFLVPVELFPGGLRWLAEHGPLAVLLTMPVRVATGRGVAAALALQLAWAGAAAMTCRLVMASGQRRLVIHGG